MLPGSSGIAAVERTLAGRYKNMRVRCHSNATDTGDVGGKVVLSESRTIVARHEHFRACRSHHGLTLTVDRDEVLFALYRTTHPGLALILAEIQSVGSGRHPAFAHDLDVAHLGFEY